MGPREDATAGAEVGVRWGQEPRNAGSLQKLERGETWTLPRSLRKEHSPMKSITDFWPPDLSDNTSVWV